MTDSWPQTRLCCWSVWPLVITSQWVVSQCPVIYDHRSNMATWQWNMAVGRLSARRIETRICCLSLWPSHFLWHSSDVGKDAVRVPDLFGCHRCDIMIGHQHSCHISYIGDANKINDYRVSMCNQNLVHAILETRNPDLLNISGNSKSTCKKW